MPVVHDVGHDDSVQVEVVGSVVCGEVVEREVRQLQPAQLQPAQVLAAAVAGAAREYIQPDVRPLLVPTGG